MVTDVTEHPVHFPRAVLVRIFVGGKIVSAQGLAFFSLVTIGTTYAKRSGKPDHHRPQPRARPVLWQDLEVLRLFRPRPGILRAAPQRTESNQAKHAQEPDSESHSKCAFHGFTT